LALIVAAQIEHGPDAQGFEPLQVGLAQTMQRI
jgi:hypothetical protein